MAHSKAVSTPTKNTTKSLKVRKSKSSKSKKVCTSAASVSKGKNRGKKIEEDEGSTGGLKLLKRHPVTMSKMTKGRVLKKRLRVQFDRNGSPVGKNAEKMQSYIGVLARTKIPISIASWPGVDKKKKNTLWETVLTAFILGPEHRKMVLQSAGAKWREFKSRLTTVYVLPYVDDPEMLQFPPDDYRFITVDEWTAFVTERTKPAFLELHEAQKARRLKNQYDHHMSRKGYAGLREELSQTMPEEEIDRAMLWIKGRQTKQGTFKVDALKDTADKIETLKQKERSGELEISGSDDVLTLALGTPEHPGRVRGVGGYVNPTDYFRLPKCKKESVQESVRLSVRRIFEEEKQKLEEELKEKILAEEREKIVAAERAFWCSRIEQLEAKINGTVLEEGVPHVGEGKAAANEYISGQASCSKTSPKSATKLDNTMEGAVTKCLDMMERNMVQKHKKKTTKVSKPKIAKAPTEEVKDRAKENEERVAAVNNDILEIEVVDMTSIEKRRKVTPTEKECKLALGDIGHIVAIATVMTSDDPSATCHGTPLGDENLRVSIYAAIKEHAMIPFPIKDEIMTVKQAMGSWVMWPKNLIIYDEKKKASGKARKKQKRNQFSPYSDAEFDLQSLPSSLPASLKKLCEWGKEGFKDGKAICFYKEEPVFGYHAKSFLLDVDVMRLAHMAEITSSCIVVYMRYLHDVLKQFKMQDMVAFIDPTLTGEIGCGSPSQRSQNIKDRLITASPNQIFLLPYNASSHWMLTVINPETGTVYFMDPLKRRLITGEWRDVVDTAIGLFKADRIKKERGSVEWKNMAGIPPQPNDKECGYFVMRYMRDIIHDTTLSFADKWGRRANHTYGQVELDEVRNEIANYVMKNLLKL